MDELRLPNVGPRERGRIHGEHFRARIHEIAAIRTTLVAEQGSFRDEAAVLETARAHLPVLEGFDHALSEELLGIAEGADADPATIVVLNHYTDLKDVPGSLSDDEECSSLAAITDARRSTARPDLGHAWERRALRLHVAHPRARRSARAVLDVQRSPGVWRWRASTRDGLGVCINNLKSHDARVGVVWPALVRRMLAERNAEARCTCCMTAPMSSGHHYLFGDAKRHVYGVETSGERKEVVLDADVARRELRYLHTNHCLSPAIEAVSWVSEWSTSYERFAWLEKSVAKQRDRAPPRTLWARLGSHDGYPRSVCTHLASARKPHAMKTCGAILVDPDAARALGVHTAACTRPSRRLPSASEIGRVSEPFFFTWSAQRDAVGLRDRRR